MYISVYDLIKYGSCLCMLLKVSNAFIFLLNSVMMHLLNMFTG